MLSIRLGLKQRPRYSVAMLEPQETLSTMELAVLRGLASGLQSKELAGAVGRSKGTVEFYVRSLFSKFNAKSRAHLVALALCSGVLEMRQIFLDHAS